MRRLIATGDLPPEARALPEHLALARILQRAAFADQPRRLRDMEGDFHPAPVYLAQAMAVGSDRDLALDLFDALRDVVKAARLGSGDPDK